MQPSTGGARPRQASFPRREAGPARDLKEQVAYRAKRTDPNQLPPFRAGHFAEWGCVIIKTGESPPKKKGPPLYPEGGAATPGAEPEGYHAPLTHTKKTKNQKTNNHTALLRWQAGPLREPPHTGKQRPSDGGQNRAS